METNKQTNKWQAIEKEEEYCLPLTHSNLTAQDVQHAVKSTVDTILTAHLQLINTSIHIHTALTGARLDYSIISLTKMITYSSSSWGTHFNHGMD